MAEESPLLIKYKKQYEKNPRSTIFAPLAEMYRKLGMLDRALDILKDGIRNNPTYVMGYLTLASCYFDQGQFPMAYATIRPLVDSNHDNLRLLKLFARICFELGHNDEALESYKYLLFLNPRDNETALKVRELEDCGPSPAPVMSKPTFFDEESLHATPEDDIDQWTQVDFGSRDPAVVEDSWSLEQVNDISFDEEEKILESVESVEEADDSEVFENSISEEESLVDDVDAEEPTVSESSSVSEDSNSEPISDESSPIVTHTLVDLYCAQGLYLKAKEVLAKILELNPTDQKTIDRMAEIKEKISNEELEDTNGDNAILAALDARLAEEELSKNSIKEEKLQKFLEAIKRRSNVKREFLK